MQLFRQGNLLNSTGKISWQKRLPCLNTLLWHKLSPWLSQFSLKDGTNAQHMHLCFQVISSQDVSESQVAPPLFFEHNGCTQVTAADCLLSSKLCTAVHMPAATYRLSFSSDCQLDGGDMSRLQFAAEDEMPRTYSACSDDKLVSVGQCDNCPPPMLELLQQSNHWRR